MTIAVIIALINVPFSKTSINNENFVFSSKELADGLPNSVLFGMPVGFMWLSYPNY